MEYICIDSLTYNILLIPIYVLSSCILLSYIFTLSINIYFLVKQSNIRENARKNLTDAKQILHLFRSAAIPFTVVLLLFFIFILMLELLNNKNLYLNPITTIPNDPEVWGNMATCFTLPLALVSFFYVYRAFQSQVMASRRSSFDCVFNQMFAQHNILREKVSRHKVFWEKDQVDFFTYFRLLACKNIDANISTCYFYSRFIEAYDLHGAVDLKNYFKFIYHEVRMVTINEYLNDYIKRRYIRLIQGQMNNDELFCYLINQIDYLSIMHNEHSEEYAKDLKYYNFFEDLCNDKIYQKYIQGINKLNDKELKKLTNWEQL